MTLETVVTALETVVTALETGARAEEIAPLSFYLRCERQLESAL